MSAMDAFKNSAKGREVEAVLTDPNWQFEMVCLSKHGLPAAQAVGRELMRRTGGLGDTERQLVGRWIREIMAAKGWTVAATNARVAKGTGFTRAATYKPVSKAPKPDGDGDPFVAFSEWAGEADEQAWRDL